MMTLPQRRCAAFVAAGRTPSRRPCQRLSARIEWLPSTLALQGVLRTVPIRRILRNAFTMFARAAYIAVAPSMLLTIAVPVEEERGFKLLPLRLPLLPHTPQLPRFRRRQVFPQFQARRRPHRPLVFNPPPCQPHARQRKGTQPVLRAWVRSTAF